MAAALKRRGYPTKEERQPWLDEFKYEYNHLRPHEALEMQTPATVWHQSERRYDPNPRRWEYGEGSEVMKVTPEGHIRVDGRRWEISRVLAGEWAQVIRLKERILVYYCRSLVRELDQLSHRSFAVKLSWSDACEGCPGALHVF